MIRESRHQLSLNDLSLDIIRHIATFLSLKSFYNLKATCKSFEALLYNGRNYPSFNQFLFLFRISEVPTPQRRVSLTELDGLMAAMVRKRQISPRQISKDILTKCVYYEHFELFKAIIETDIGKIKMQFLLCEVVTQARLKMLELLVLTDVDIEAKEQLSDSENKHATPVITALTKSEIEILDLLLKNGANGELLDTSIDKTPLMRAARRIDPECCEVLINNGVNINAVNQEGCPALFYSRNIAIFRYLIDKGASIHIKDARGSTMLHFTVEMKKLQLYLELLKLGIDSSIRNMDGLTALDLIKIEYKGVKGLKFKELTEREIVEELVRRKF